MQAPGTRYNNCHQYYNEQSSAVLGRQGVRADEGAGLRLSIAFPVAL